MLVTEKIHNSNKRNINLNTLLSTIISIVYAFCLVYFIPMSDEIKDRANYLIYAEDSNLFILKYVAGGLVSAFFNEPGWLGINMFLKSFLEAELVVSVIIFFSAFLSAFLVLKVNPKYFLFLVLVLFLPQVIVKYVVHLRQGLAISIFLLGWFCISTKWRCFWFISACLIHASFFFVIALYIMSMMMRRWNFSIDLRTAVAVISGFSVSFGLGLVASFLGARQAEQYSFSAAETSGMGFVFWFGIFLLYWVQGRRFTKQHAFSMTVIVFYLTTYFFIEVTGRIFESALIIVLLSSIDLTSWRKILFLFVLPLYAILMWLFRINEPWLGWGTGL